MGPKKPKEERSSSQLESLPQSVKMQKLPSFLPEKERYDLLKLRNNFKTYDTNPTQPAKPKLLDAQSKHTGSSWLETSPGYEIKSIKSR
jgi:hypothetical protein